MWTLLVELTSFATIQMCLFAAQFEIAANEGIVNNQKLFAVS